MLDYTSLQFGFLSLTNVKTEVVYINSTKLLLKAFNKT